MFLFQIDDEVALKRLELSDADRLFQLTDQSRDHLRPWLPWVDHTKTVDDSKAFIQSSLKTFSNRQGLTTGILYKGELAGIISFNSLDWKNEIGYIGYWLGVNYQGNGIMIRAVSGLIDYAFYSLGLNRIEIRAAVGNRKSRAIPERLGFMLEGQIRQAEWLHEDYTDHAVYGILADEWDSQKLNGF
ncbi:GNAT family N-acetyltransferase [Lentibacillus cibarius]|uniref:GNAT family N-acetyltransferase n=1 Tax=Lentibacillus cibarius TaxID=2583219 RepID=A0A549YGR0_9BACI|nr:GNAT family protein [Lentibacillus cibarius]TMN22244.1 GNAT family N-acetyltransferase [Lentibacillus cibarius]TRM11017.1 GNAT family N-acetyltransferase [Lentibacillus cibarius]